MNIENHYNSIKKACNIVTNGHELKDDLAQEVALVMLTSDLSKVKNIEAYIFMVAYYKWNSNNGKDIGSKDNSFKGLYRDYSIINCYDTEDLKHCLTEEESVNRFDRLYSTINKLPANEQQIIKEYMRFNCNTSNFSKSCDISRRNLDLRIKSIIEKCKTIK